MIEKKALITGIAGQDGSYLAELLLEKGYEIYGTAHRADTHSLRRVAHILDDITILDEDILTQGSVDKVVSTVEPDEIYNLAGPSFVPISWENPVYTAEVIGLTVARLLEAIRRFKSDTRLYQASSSELFGNPLHSPQNEESILNPRNPYGAAKLYAHLLIKSYREKYNIFACSGILFNHESPRRPIEYVTRKITNTVARIKLGDKSELRIGSTDAIRDWGYSPDYVKAMWAMLSAQEADDYVISTGEPHSVGEFIEEAFGYVDLDWRDYVVEDESLLRPKEGLPLVGDSSKAREKLKWTPEVDFKTLVHIMMDSDMVKVKKQLEGESA